MEARRPLLAVFLFAALLSGCAGTAPIGRANSTWGFGPGASLDLGGPASDAPGGTPDVPSVEPPSEASPQGYARTRAPSAPGGIYAEAFAVPAAFVAFQSEGPNVPDPKLDTGAGFGVGAGVSNGDQGVGLLYIGTFHDSDRLSGTTEMHSFLADFRARGLIWHQGDSNGYLHFTAGGGFTDIQTPGGVRDETEGIIQLRGLLELEFHHRFSLHLGGGGFLFGHPGDTVGYGSWLMAGGGLRF